MAKNNWKHYIEHHDEKNGKKTTHRIWREADTNNELSFDHYGFGILKLKENGKTTFQAIICRENWNRPGYAHGEKFSRIEDAYADLDELIVCCGKTFGFFCGMKDAYYTDRYRDRNAMLDAAEKCGLV